MTYAIVSNRLGEQVRVVRDGTRLYTSERRAMNYGCARYAAPCGGKWVALPFWRPGGGINYYYTEDEYATMLGVPCKE